MKFLLLSLVLLLANAMAVAPAQSKIDNNRYTPVKANSKKITSKQQAAKIAKKRFGGKVLGVQNLNGEAFRVKLLTAKGHVIYVTVDAYTGKASR
ncbi:PepSY domain-containing protein [Thalassotalea ponticola]|uniref:PepSY domain-containing protein n=1 Tax=Thalassotalea ponticola TaxID=1523392 RepID=UPI0025B2927D|nr:PepSY domain-containing protein [Thalassotalea ponticola]MDN3653087.1 PepSY domain-containing protein [Thalassotalea ponticola]